MIKQRVILIGLDGANPDLIRHYVSQGVMPNFKRLMERGVFGEYLSAVPPNTTVNWTTIATGAHPGTHGITDFWPHFPGTPLDQVDDAFNSALVRAEQIWKTAVLNGKKAMVQNYPVSWPWDAEDGIFIGAEGTPYSGSVFELKPSSGYVSAAAQAGATRADVIAFTGTDTERTGTLTLIPTAGKSQSSVSYTVKVTKSRSSVFDSVGFYDSQDNMVSWLCQGSWSDWIAAEFTIDGQPRIGRFRFYITECSDDGERIKIYVSQIFPEDNFTVPADLSDELVSEIGPHLSYCGSGPWRRGWHPINAWFDEMRYKGHWMANAGVYAINKYDTDLYYSHFHMFDHIYHYIWGFQDPATDWYDESVADFYESWIKEGHIIADEVLGIYLEGLDDGNTHFVLVSDHGLIPHIKSVSINNLLAANALITYSAGEDGRPLVDWSQTLAYKPGDAAHIYINCIGRDPDGIVSSEEYEVVQERIIKVLLDFVDDENGKHPVAVALKKKDAVQYGLFGEMVGDVIVMMNAEYTAQMDAPLSLDGRILVKMGPQEEGDSLSHDATFHAVHGYTLPTSKLGRGGSEAGMLMFVGPKIKAGVDLDVPVPAVNVAPTVAHLAGIPAPAQCDGQVLFNILEG
ncbi:MAG: alkaline phosphatase family protein [Chloroflexota bacterium]